jgi:ligand-binding sensor domain-containing protein/signal transduction histidine kinase
MVKQRNSLLLLSRLLLLVTLLTSFHKHVTAQTPTNNIKFRQYSIEQGLSQVACSAIIQDSKGFLWIGTQDGLNRFDGYTFTHFKHIPHDSASISDNYILSLYEDNQGNLWVGTYGGGLNLYDYSTKSFTHFKNDPLEKGTLSHNDVFSIFQDKQGSLWVSTRDGLNRYDYSTKRFIHFKSDPQEKGTLSNNDVRSIFQDNQGNLWVGTQGGGLNLYDYSTESFIHFKNDPQKKGTLSNNYIFSITQDKQGNLWVGTFGGGLNLYDYSTINFTHFKNDPQEKRTMSNNDVRSIFQDKQGNLWVGTWGGGLNLYDYSTESFTYFKNDPQEKGTLSNNNVRSIFQDNQGNLWVGTYGGGLNLYDYSTESFTHFKNDPQEKGTLSNNNVQSISQDKQGNLWVGTLDGLNLYDYSTKSFTHFKNDPLEKGTLSHNDVLSVFQDKQGNLWVGTGGGLNLYDYSTKSFMHYQHDSNNPNSISHNDVEHISEDKEGNLWITCFGGGINKFNPKTGIFTRYLQADGILPTDGCSCALPDDKGILWVSTVNGFLSFNPQTNEAIYYDEKDGLQGLGFNVGSCFKAKDGTMYFGGINGFNAFHPDSIQQSKYMPPVQLTNFQLFNKDVPLNHQVTDSLKENLLYTLPKNITYMEKLILPHDAYVMSFEYASLDFPIAERNNYMYKLDNFDSEWNKVGTQRKATYTNLSPGDYVFRVRGTNNDGVWSDNEVALPITITPPWWLTWWAKTLWVSLFLGFFLAIYKLRTTALKKQRANLEVQVEQRTVQLSEQQEVLRSQNDQLIELNEEKDGILGIVAHDLRSPLSQIKGLTQLVEMTGELEDEQKEYFQKINVSLDKGNQLISDLLDVSNFQHNSSTAKLTLEEVDVANLIDELHENSRKNAALKKQQLTFESDASAPLKTDKFLLWRVLENLISNAIKYSPEGKPIVVTAKQHNEQTEFVIKDEGLGFSEDDKKKMFGKFQKLSAQPTGGEISTGLGLSIVKMIVEKLGGTIEVESEQHVGSEFIVTLPNLT